MMLDTVTVLLLGAVILATLTEIAFHFLMTTKMETGQKLAGNSIAQTLIPERPVHDQPHWVDAGHSAVLFQLNTEPHLDGFGKTSATTVLGIIEYAEGYYLATAFLRPDQPIQIRRRMVKDVAKHDVEAFLREQGRLPQPESDNNV